MNNTACMVVDYQNGFASKITNELYVNGGEDIAPYINQIMRETKSKGGIVVASKDWHPAGNVSFASNFKNKQPITVVGPADPRAWITLEEVQLWKTPNEGLSKKAGFTQNELEIYLRVLGGKAIMWPDHCQAFTPGADFYPGFDSTLVDSIVIKGDEECEHPYSAFPGREMNTKSRTLEQIFDEANTKIIQVVGLATDYCVKDTALDLVKTGKYRVEILLQGMRAVSPDTEKAAIELMRKEGIIIVE